MKISYKVPLIATGVILSAFAFFGSFQYFEMRKSITVQTKSNVNEISTVLSTDITRWLNERLKTIEGMANIMAQNVSPDAIDEDFMVKILGNPAYKADASLYYVVTQGGDGKLITTRKLKLPEGWDGRTRPWYKLATQYDYPVVTKPYVDSERGHLIVSGAYRLKIQDQFVGVIASDIELTDIANAVNTVNFNNTGYAYLLNAAGEVISSPDKSMNGKNIRDVYSGQPKMVNTLQESSIDGRAVLTSFYPLKQFNASEKGWVLGVVIDKEKAFAPATKLLIEQAIAALIAIVLASIVFYFFMRSALIRPVSELTRQADEISRGKLKQDVYGLHRKDEIGELAEAVQRMQKALNMAMTKLTASRKKMSDSN